jgi:hypothetical protein
MYRNNDTPDSNPKRFVRDFEREVKLNMDDDSGSNERSLVGKLLK